MNPLDTAPVVGDFLIALFIVGLVTGLVVWIFLRTRPSANWPIHARTEKLRGVLPPGASRRVRPMAERVAANQTGSVRLMRSDGSSYYLMNGEEFDWPEDEDAEFVVRHYER